MRRTRPVLVVLAALVALLAASCSGGGKKDVAATTTTAPATTTTAPLPTWPLTGLPDAAAPTAGNHPAVVVKVDDGINSRPQSGLTQADVVYEEEVEGVTRLAAVFHSKLPDVVGDVRSARSSDIDILAGLSKPLFAWSGGNPGVTAQVLTAARDGILTNASVDVATPAYYRASGRGGAPYNLYVHPSQLLQLRAPAGQGAPSPLFTYRAAGTPAPAGALPSAGVTIPFTSNTTVSYVWDKDRKAWDRFQVDGQHPPADSAFVDADGTQIAPTNVVVMYVAYGVSAADSRSPQAQTVGTGEAAVFTDGTFVPARWVRPSASEPAKLLDSAGNPIALTPGPTWVALPRAGTPASLLDQSAADAFLAVRR